MEYSQHTTLCFVKYSTLHSQQNVEVERNLAAAVVAADTPAVRIAGPVAAAKVDSDTDFGTETHPGLSTTDCNCNVLDSFAAVVAVADKNQPATSTSKLIEF